MRWKDRRQVERRTRGERGAALVEAAIISPVVVLLILGMIEFGLIFRDYLTIANTTRSAARVASAAGADAGSDYEILQALKGASSALPSGTIERIVIFKSNTPNGEVPVGCLTGSLAATCNRYVEADLARPKTDFGCTGTAPDRFWCPTTRNDRQAGPPDWVGIYITVRHDYVSGMFGSSRKLSDTTVMRIEPTRL